MCAVVIAIVFRFLVENESPRLVAFVDFSGDYLFGVGPIENTLMYATLYQVRCSVPTKIYTVWEHGEIQKGSTNGFQEEHK